MMSYDMYILYVYYSIVHYIFGKIKNEWNHQVTCTTTTTTLLLTETQRKTVQLPRPAGDHMLLLPASEQCITIIEKF